MKRPTREAIGIALPIVRLNINASEANLRVDYARQLELWQAGVALDPPMKHRELAELSGVSTSAVSVALAKARDAATDLR